MAVTTVWMAAAVLLACLRPSATLSVLTNYQSLLNVITNIVEQDEYWAQAFDQGVYYKLDRSLYPHIVDEELLKDARDQPITMVASDAGEAAAAADGKAEVKADDKGDAIRPMRFVRNVMRKRYRIGSLLQMAGEVLQKSLACVSYKHAVHLMKLIRVEISRKTSDRKSLSWSSKSIAAVARMVITMASLQHADKELLQTASFLDMYADSQEVVKGFKGPTRSEKFNLTPALDKISRSMFDYIGQNCVRAPADELAVAKELRVLVSPSLYNTIKSKSISTAAYKDMFKNIMGKITQLFEALPIPPGMSLHQWNEIMHFKREAEGDEMLDFIRINRH